MATHDTYLTTDAGPGLPRPTDRVGQLDAPRIGPSRLIYENPYQKVYHVEADFGDFTKEYYVTDTGQRAGIVAVVRDSVLLVRQYRLLIDGLAWELPGGRVDDGETPEVAAVRECLEETGVRCLDPRPLVFYHAGLDTRHNPTHIFYSDQVAEKCETENIHLQEVSGSAWVPLDSCVEMIFEGKIVDSFSIAGLLAYRTRFGA